jgi:serine/threonine-protein kinase
MAEVPPGEEGSLSLSARLRLDEACDRFEDALKAGDRPRLEDLLGGADGAERQALLKELLRVELELRHEAGERPEPEEYQRRFPGHEDLIREAFAHAVTVGASAGGPRSGSAGLPAVRGYELLGVLGEGGMGVVYKARQLRPSRLVALKMIRAARAAGPAELARFRTEYESVARLAHPQVVQIYEVGEHDGLPFFSMELAEGGNLHKKLAGKPLAVRYAAELTAGLARAVQHLHEHGVVHRDLKPGNVVLTGDGACKITDFGLAKLLDSPHAPSAAANELTRTGNWTHSGEALGTPAYMAPEQARGEVGGPDGRVESYALVDVYALGAVLYELLTGRPPFRGATRRDTLEQVCTQEPVPPSRHRAGLSRDLEAVCLKCLEKLPAKRYPSAKALAEDLGRWLRGEPTAARPARWPARAWRAVRRRPLLSAAVLLCLALGALGWWARHASDPEREVRKIEARLAEGRRVDLIGESGPPVWHRWEQGEEAGRASAAADGSFSVHCWGFGLLDVVREVPCGRFRVRAEVRHEKSDRVGEVGLYVARRAYPGPTAPVHSFITLTFNDVVVPTRPAGLPVQQAVPANNPVYLTPYLHCGRRGVPLDKRLAGDWPRLCKAAGFVGGPWRTLRADVSAKRVRAWWEDGKVVGELTAARVRRETEAAVREMRELLPGDLTLEGIEHGFDPHGAVGLMVLKGSASFRRVVIEPLSEEE